MQRMQRKVHVTFLPKTADEGQVAAVLNAYDEADKMFTKLIESSKAWRDAWTDILRKELTTLEELETIYAPIMGAMDSHESPIVHADTPADQLARVSDLRQEYAQLKVDMQEEVNSMDTKLIQKAAEAKEHIQPVKKTIKKRQDKKVDFERYQKLVDNARRKSARSDRENSALAKHEGHLERATEEYRTADSHLRATLPPIVEAAFSILPHLLATQIMIQNTLLAQVYTTLHNYSLDHQFQSPPPSMEQVVATWEADYKPVQNQIETGIQAIRTGKAIRKPMTLGEQKRSMTGLNVRNNISNRRASNQSTEPTPRLSPRPSIASNISDEPPPVPTPPAIDHSSKPRMSPSPSLGPQYIMPHRLQSASSLSTPTGNLAKTYASNPVVASPEAQQENDRFSPIASRTDYFSRDRLPSTSSTASVPVTSPPQPMGLGIASAAASIAAQKKKPPPPPPPKRLPSAQGNWVTALYDFDGQSEGDLVFREGDRIKIVEKTGSTDDWWEGELRGKQGAFPANYVR
ncbi:MAG: hypothetical protein M1820_001811 [Bogoriella megaspora]|nr:MAG: hypothetical protein M1820_001811 [Bogoriella megaspora]